MTSYFGAVGIRVTIRPMERGAFFKEYQEKRLKQIIQSTSAAFGNAATRLDAFVAASGLFTYGTYPEIEDLVRRQAMEMDRGKREMILHRAQQLIHEKAMYAPLLEVANVAGYGPRVAESAIASSRTCRARRPTRSFASRVSSRRQAPEEVPWPAYRSSPEIRSSRKKGPHTTPSC